MSKPLRILQITEVPSAGVGRHLSELSVELVERGHDVHLIYSPTRADSFFLNAVKDCESLKKCVVKMRRSPHPSDIAAVGLVNQYILKHGPFDVIHGHSSKGGAIARLAIPCRKTRFIYTPHTMYTMNPNLSRMAYHIYRRIELALALRTDELIANSPEEERHIVALGVPARKVHYIHYGIAPNPPLERSVARAEFGLPADAVIIGFVGRLEPQKDPVLLLNAMRQVMSRHPNVVLAVVGSGSLEASLKQLAIDLGIQEKVFWLGYRSGVRLMAAIDLLAVTSSYDAVSYTLIEGLFTGLPMISTEYAGVDIAIVEGRNGFIVPSRDPNDFAAAFEPLLASSDQRQQFRQASLQKAGEFTLDKMVTRTVALYSSAEAR